MSDVSRRPQVSALCDGKDGAINPYVISIRQTKLRKQIHSLAKKGHTVAVYNGMVYDLMDCVNLPPTRRTQAPPNIRTKFMD